MKKILLSLSVLVISLTVVKAQQLPDYTLAKQNLFNYNPAVAGTEEASVVSITAKTEWTKIKESPFSANLVYHQPLKNEHIGLGGSLVTDFTGPTSYVGLNLSFAYHLIFSEYRPGVSERKVLSFGLSGSVVQYSINGSKIQLDIPQDDALYAYKGSQFYPDAAFGIHYKSKRVTASLSVPQLLHLDVPITSRQIEKDAQLRKMQHYFGFFSYKILLNKKAMNNTKMYLEPIVNLHYVIGAPFQGVVSLRYSLDEVFFTEVGYRSLSTMIFGAGFTIAKRFSLSYAYDFNMSTTRSDLGSVHELQLRFKFNETNF
ncbi:MAG: type IX secretion system PorP/SprF family membrane protein [Planctomycetota bacterium]|jgi:type IX secretion system PorP/SprF family membrane protein